MILRRSFRRFAAVAAACAISLQALWPLLSHARPKDLSLLAPLCTVDGVTHYLEIKAGRTTPLEQRSAQHGEHCKLCVFGDGKAVASLPPDCPAFLLVLDGNPAIAPPAASYHGAAQSLPAQPRAPPAFS